jgi:hypothetical protein
MPETKNVSKHRSTIYPLSLSISLIAGAVILSFVDLMFLNDVIGKILDVGSTESMFVAFVLGMVGIGVMFHEGVRAAHGETNVWHTLGYYALWLLLGIAFVLIRLFSASILQLDEATGDEAILSIFGLNIREVDLVIAPLMLLLYVATGLMVKDGSKHLHLSPDYVKWKADRKEARAKRLTTEEQRRIKAEERMQKVQEAAAAAQAARMKEVEEERQKQKTDGESAAMKAALNGNYDQALAQYNAKLSEMKEKYRRISSNIDYIKSITADEADFKNTVKPSLLRIVDKSVKSTQYAIALAIHNKTGEDIVGLRQEIDDHNAKHDRDV